MNYFGLEIPEDDVLGCAGSMQFPDGGSGYQMMYVTESWDGSGKC